jgi:penicillin-binding protein 1A
MKRLEVPWSKAWKMLSPIEHTVQQQKRPPEPLSGASPPWPGGRRKSIRERLEKSPRSASKGACVQDRVQPEETADPHPKNESSIDSEPRGASVKPLSSFLRGLARSVAASFGVVLNLGMLALTAAGAFVAVTLNEFPNTEVLKEVRLQEPLRVYSADGSLMAEYGEQRRTPASFDEIPALVVKAFLATEDARFFAHEGVDLIGIARAALVYARTGERTQGGSTITMQVARNFFLSREKTFQRKLAEILLSLHIERTLTKEEILALYLNKIFFGHRAYGISAAAALYYDKGLDQLNIAEIAMLAGIPKAPSSNNPVSNPQRAHERRNYVLRRMRDLGYINEEEFRTASETTDQARLHLNELDLEAGYVAEIVRQEMIERFGEDAYRDGYRVTTTIEPWLQRAAQDAVRKSIREYDRRHGYRGAEAKFDVVGDDDEELDLLLNQARPLPDLAAGIVVQARAKGAQVYIGKNKRVALGLDQVKWARPFKNEDEKGGMPRKVTDAVAVGDLIRLWQGDDGTWELSQTPAVAGALVSLSPANGAIRALVGGYYFKDSKFNRAVDARRQPGSSFKPFVYAAALNKGYTPVSLVRDEPISIRTNQGEMWTPKNFDHKTMGRIPMRKALRLSRNLASVNLLSRIGLQEARDYIQRFGFDLKELPQGLSLVLGTAEVPPLQMAGAYALFANGGFRVVPYLISRVENGAGEVVFEANPPRACSDCWARYDESTIDPVPAQQVESNLAERVLDPRLVYQMTSMMQDAIKRGTGRKALELEREDIAGKTGTTNDVRDSWFCGFQKDFVTVVWMGFDENQPLGKGETGGQAALGMWVDFMREALKDKPQAVLNPPQGMVKLSRGWFREEYANALQGPKPLGYARRGWGGKNGGDRSVKRRAPRVIDELF